MLKESRGQRLPLKDLLGNDSTFGLSSQRQNLSLKHICQRSLVRLTQISKNSLFVLSRLIVAMVMAVKIKKMLISNITLCMKSDKSMQMWLTILMLLSNNKVLIQIVLQERLKVKKNCLTVQRTVGPSQKQSLGSKSKLAVWWGRRVKVHRKRLLESF